MFTKKDFEHVQILERNFLCSYHIVRYQLYDNPENEQSKRTKFCRGLIRNEGCIKEFFFKRLFERNSLKLSQFHVYFMVRIMKKKKMVNYDKLKLLKQEFDVRRSIRHTFLINFVCSFQDLKQVYYITELALGGYFFYYLRDRKYLSSDEAAFYIAEIIIAIQYLHRKRLLYRSLFPNTVMLSETGHIKLRFDFLNKQGLELNDFENHIQYISIDYISGDFVRSDSDYWEIGVILYEILTGYNPFLGNSFIDTRYNILYKPVEFPESFDLSAKDLIQSLLKRNRKERLGYMPADAKLIRNHPFFRMLDWDAMEECRVPPPIAIKTEFESSKTSRSLDDMFDFNYHHDQTDGYGEAFKFYGGGQFKKYKPW